MPTEIKHHGEMLPETTEVTERLNKAKGGWIHLTRQADGKAFALPAGAVLDVSSSRGYSPRADLASRLMFS